jgi:hypothetical protein
MTTPSPGSTPPSDFLQSSIRDREIRDSGTQDTKTLSGDSGTSNPRFEIVGFEIPELKTQKRFPVIPEVKT